MTPSVSDPTLGQLAELVKVPFSTVRNWVTSYNLKPYRDDRNRQRFYPPAVEAAQTISRLREEGRESEWIRQEIANLIAQLPEPPPEVEMVEPLPMDLVPANDAELVQFFQTMQATLTATQEGIRSTEDLTRSVLSTQEALAVTVATHQVALEETLQRQNNALNEQLTVIKTQLTHSDDTALTLIQSLVTKLDSVQAELTDLKAKGIQPWYKRLWS